MGINKMPFFGLTVEGDFDRYPLAKRMEDLIID